MGSVLLTRLRSQINAVVNHFDASDEFCRSLLALLAMYQDETPKSGRWIEQSSDITATNVPASVLSELDSHLSLLAKEKPDAALANADHLWASSQYEAKHIAITLIANLGSGYRTQTIERIQQWAKPDLYPALLDDILQAFENKPDTILETEWVDSLSIWLQSQDDDLMRLGIRALNRTIKMNYENLPKVFTILTPIIQEPRIAIQKDLIDLISSLIAQSEAETASFLIMVALLHPRADFLAFIRKILPLFDPYFQNEIKSSLS